MKKLGSPPPRSESVCVGRFDADPAHHRGRAYDGGRTDSDNQLTATRRNTDSSFDDDGLAIRDIDCVAGKVGGVRLSDIAARHSVSAFGMCEKADVVRPLDRDSVFVQRVLCVILLCSDSCHCRPHPHHSFVPHEVRPGAVVGIWVHHACAFWIREDVPTSHAATPGTFSMVRCRLRRRALLPPAGSAIRPDRRRTCPSLWSWCRQAHGCQ